MTTIYCTACDERLTLHADGTFACACEGPINPLDGGDPIPETWEMPGEDADSVYRELRRIAAAEAVNDALLGVTVISVNAIDEGYAIAVEITDTEYELDDDDKDSAISDLHAAGFEAEWLDDYEPQANGCTRVTIFATRRKLLEPVDAP